MSYSLIKGYVTGRYVIYKNFERLVKICIAQAFKTENISKTSSARNKVKSFF